MRGPREARRTVATPRGPRGYPLQPAPARPPVRPLVPALPCPRRRPTSLPRLRLSPRRRRRRRTSRTGPREGPGRGCGPPWKGGLEPRRPARPRPPRKPRPPVPPRPPLWSLGLDLPWPAGRTAGSAARQPDPGSRIPDPGSPPPAASGLWRLQGWAAAEEGLRDWKEGSGKERRQGSRDLGMALGAKLHGDDALPGFLRVLQFGSMLMQCLLNWEGEGEWGCMNK